MGIVILHKKRVHFAFLVLGMVSLYLACDAVDQETARAMWLADTFVEDHWHLIQRDPDLVAGKWRKMRGEYLDGHTSLYPYFRGSLPQMYRDFSGDYLDLTPSAYVSEEGALVHLIGDPHLENLSSQIDDQGHLYLDWDDFDSAGYGPWIWDLRRLALSWWILAYTIDDLTKSTEWITHLVQGYEHVILGQDYILPRQGNEVPKVLQNFFQNVDSQIEQQKLSSRYLIQNDQQKIHLRRGEIREPDQIGVIKDELRTIEGNELALIERVAQRLIEMKSTLGTLKDAVRKYGQGVSSYPLLRYLVLFEGISADAHDDEIWEFKELSDRPFMYGNRLYPSRNFSDLGARVLGSRRVLQWGQASELQGALPCWVVSVGNLTLQVRRRSAALKGLSFDDLISFARDVQNDFERSEHLNDLDAFARLTGVMLAQAHQRALTSLGTQAGTVIAHDLKQNPSEQLIEETLNFSRDYGKQLVLDRSLLIQLIDEHGPLLGMRRGRE